MSSACCLAQPFLSRLNRFWFVPHAPASSAFPSSIQGAPLGIWWQLNTFLWIGFKASFPQVLSRMEERGWVGALVTFCINVLRKTQLLQPNPLKTKTVEQSSQSRQPATLKARNELEAEHSAFLLRCCKLGALRILKPVLPFGWQFVSFPATVLLSFRRSALWLFMASLYIRLMRHSLRDGSPLWKLNSYLPICCPL